MKHVKNIGLTALIMFVSLVITLALLFSIRDLNAQVSDGQRVDAATTNNAFWKRTTNDSGTGVYQLLNATAPSGSSVTNMQREFNSLASYMGKTIGSAKDDLPSWINNDVGASTDPLKLRADLLTAKFNSTYGHLHTGIAGDAPTLGASSIAANAAIEFSKMEALTPNRVLVSDGSSVVSASSVTSTTLGYLDATSSIQDQLNGKQPTGDYITALTGDVTAVGPGSTTATVVSVGESSAANIHSAELLANAATDANTANAIVKRDASGNFSAGTITAALVGTASGNAAYTPNQYGVLLSGSGTTMSVLAPDASTTKVLTSGGASANPSWQSIVESISGHIVEPTNMTYVLDQAAAFAYTINSITIQTSDGTITAKLQIGGVDVTGCTAISVSSGATTATCTAANSVSTTNKVTLVTTGNTGGADLTFTVKVTR